MREDNRSKCISSCLTSVKVYLYRSKSAGVFIIRVELLVAVVSLIVSYWYSVIGQDLGLPLDVGFGGHG